MKISVILHTWDPYEDCWDPFFILFKKYWPDFEGTIYINTENKDYTFDGLDVRPLKVGLKNNPDQLPLEWSERLIRGLNEIKDEVVLYMQEDYFLKDFVKNNLVLEYYSLISNSHEIDCIHLTDQVAKPLLTSKKINNLYLSDPDSRDLVSCQAAFWKKSAFLKILKKEENGWEFEEYGSRRAKYLNMKFYTPDRNFVKIDEQEIIPYIFTGIVSGKWHKQVPKLFNENNIKIDFSKRGMAIKTKKINFLHRLQNKFKRVILRFTCWKDIFTIKFLKKGNK